MRYLSFSLSIDLLNVKKKSVVDNMEVVTEQKIALVEDDPVVRHTTQSGWT